MIINNTTIVTKQTKNIFILYFLKSKNQVKLIFIRHQERV